MNRTELVEKISRMSGLEVAECGIVLDSLEKVFETELKGSKRKRYMFDTLYGLMTLLKKLRYK